MSRRLRFISVGGVLGAAGAACIWHLEHAVLAAGVSAASAGVGASHLLFLVSLPWNGAVLLPMLIINVLTGADGPAFLTPFFYAMPIVAGIGWAWLASLVPWRRRRTATVIPPAV
jgi:hypothetical protein